MKHHTLITGLLVLIFGLFMSYEMKPVKADFIGNMIKLSLQAEVEAVSEWGSVPYNEFVPSLGDYFMVDVTNGRGYLMNNFTQTYTGFLLMTGTSRTPTPLKDWVVLEKNIQSNRIIFSESGEFFRMFEDGTKRTSYGIHGYAYFEEEIVEGRKFLSRGCILVADDVLDLIEESYVLNGNSLKVLTRESVDPVML